MKSKPFMSSAQRRHESQKPSSPWGSLMTRFIAKREAEILPFVSFPVLGARRNASQDIDLPVVTHPMKDVLLYLCKGTF